jgi:hypothetical protein
LMPTDPAAKKEMQLKELKNGRLVSQSLALRKDIQCIVSFEYAHLLRLFVSY